LPEAGAFGDAVNAAIERMKTMARLPSEIIAALTNQKLD
jgi:hypothetical protein